MQFTRPHCLSVRSTVATTRTAPGSKRTCRPWSSMVARLASAWAARALATGPDKVVANRERAVRERNSRAGYLLLAPQSRTCVRSANVDQWPLPHTSPRTSHHP